MTSVDALERLAAMTVPQGEWTLTVDFGAAFTEATASSPENHQEILIDDERRMPSVVSVNDAGELCVGRAAEEIARTRPDRAERELKRRLGEKTAIVLGDRSYDPVVLVAAVLRHAADAAIDQVGSTPLRVQLTHPDSWSDARIAKLVEAGSNAGLVNVGTEAESVAAGPTGAPATAPTLVATDTEGANESAAPRTVFEKVPQSGTATMPPQPPNAYTPIPPTPAEADFPKSSARKPVLAGIAIGAVLVAGLGFALTRGDSSTASATTTSATTTATIALAVAETTPTKKNPVTLPPRKSPTTLFPSKDPDDASPPRPLTPTTVPLRKTPTTSVKTPPTTIAPIPTTTHPRATVPTTTPVPPPPTTKAPATTAPVANNPQQTVDQMVLSPDDIAKAAATTGWRTGTYPESAPLCGLALPTPVAQQWSPVNVSVGDGAYINVTTYAYAMTSAADMKAMTDTVYQSAAQCPDKTFEQGGQRFTLEFIKPSESKPPLVDYSLEFGYRGKSDAGTSMAAYVAYTTLGNYAIRTEYQVFGQNFSEADGTAAGKIRIAQIVNLFVNASHG
jgi:hypothetical protein